ncbi:hypothetical protein B0I31_10821 [Saccharothrix carnea]|uniref:Uncharacterized protein n=2 Tax=Saccharothrix carnea TaxID=1280637 RepID=A0A2P8I541_SACCR|nr:hypothetical protein B0I31_10821 [Saccharothrix carnea]
MHDLPVDVIATVGRHVDPAVLGPQRPGVRVERCLPQGSVPPGCDLVISAEMPDLPEPARVVPLLERPAR